MLPMRVTGLETELSLLHGNVGVSTGSQEVAVGPWVPGNGKGLAERKLQKVWAH